MTTACRRSFDGTPNEIRGRDPVCGRQCARGTTIVNWRPRIRGGEVFSGAIVPVFGRFRAAFSGKASPVQLWWGSFDLAVNRFSGREAPPHPGGMAGLPDRVAREAYSHEVASAGFWAAGAAEAEPFFYSYIYPEADGYRTAERPLWPFRRNLWRVCPSLRRSSSVGRSSANSGGIPSILPTKPAADLARWDRAALEREPVAP